MQTAQVRVARKGERRLGYALAVLGNLALLWVAGNIVEWGLLPFLTEDFQQVVPWMGLSLSIAVVANVVYQFDDRSVVKAGGDIATNLVGLYATYRLLSVFPFDFSAYEFDWPIVVSVLLTLGMVGAAVGIVVSVARLVTARPTR